MDEEPYLEILKPLEGKLKLGFLAGRANNFDRYIKAPASGLGYTYEQGSRGQTLDNHPSHGLSHELFMTPACWALASMGQEFFVLPGLYQKSLRFPFNVRYGDMVQESDLDVLVLWVDPLADWRWGSYGEPNASEIEVAELRLVYHGTSRTAITLFSYSTLPYWPAISNKLYHIKDACGNRIKGYSVDLHYYFPSGLEGNTFAYSLVWRGVDGQEKSSQSKEFFMSVPVPVDRTAAETGMPNSKSTASTTTVTKTMAMTNIRADSPAPWSGDSSENSMVTTIILGFTMSVFVFIWGLFVYWLYTVPKDQNATTQARKAARDVESEIELKWSSVHELDGSGAQRNRSVDARNMCTARSRQGGSEAEERLRRKLRGLLDSRYPDTLSAWPFKTPKCGDLRWKKKGMFIRPGPYNKAVDNPKGYEEALKKAPEKSLVLWNDPLADAKASEGRSVKLKLVKFHLLTSEVVMDLYDECGNNFKGYNVDFLYFFPYGLDQGTYGYHLAWTDHNGDEKTSVSERFSFKLENINAKLGSPSTKSISANTETVTVTETTTIVGTPATVTTTKISIKTYKASTNVVTTTVFTEAKTATPSSSHSSNGHGTAISVLLFTFLFPIIVWIIFVYWVRSKPKTIKYESGLEFVGTEDQTVIGKKGKPVYELPGDKAVYEVSTSPAGNRRKQSGISM